MKSGTLKNNFLWNTTGSLIFFGCQWLVSILVVNLSSPNSENVGLLQLAITMTQTFVAFASYGMRSYQVSDIKQIYTQSAYVKSRILTMGVSYLICAVVACILAYSPYQIAIILAYLLFRFTECLSDVYHGIAQQNNRMDIIGKSYILRALCSTGTFVIVLMLTDNILLTVIAMCVCAHIVVFCYEIPRCKVFYNKTQVSKQQIFNLLITCAPLAVYTFLSTAVASVPKLFLEKIVGTQLLGVFNSVTTPVLLLQTAATYIFVPLITHFAISYNEKNIKQFAKMFAIVSALLFSMLPLGFLVVKFLGLWGLQLLYGVGTYDEYFYLLSPMVIASVLTAFVLFISMVLTVMRCMKILIFANITAVIVAVALSTPMINTYNLQGANYTLICALGVQTLCLILCGLYVIKKEFK